MFVYKVVLCSLRSRLSRGKFYGHFNMKVFFDTLIVYLIPHVEAILPSLRIVGALPSLRELINYTN